MEQVWTWLVFIPEPRVFRVGEAHRQLARRECRFLERQFWPGC